ncbi:pectinesterase inhibitor 9-like [Syzygium oleosum]|uniref:pectinesterase inhibitor 9-like n=1 Tax=Syzygium oleosum TaxID=219896 RepID=UPI0024B91258|nr:pectinesterase inhibitor 9-like [Syzygium oleosum]
MAKPKPSLPFSFFLLFLLLSLTITPSQSFVPNHPIPAPTSFIVSSCRATRYPALCVHCLAAYGGAIQRSDHHLAQAALIVSLARARSAASFVAKLSQARRIKLRELRAVRDCVENMGDSVDGLADSVRELGRSGRDVGRDFTWHMSNVETWVSAALTDENTCMNGFGGRAMDGAVKVAVRQRVVDVAQVTSNALALVNRFASRHRPVTVAAGEP